MRADRTVGESRMLAPDPTLPAVVGVVFLATLVRSAFGFGEALVAVPLLALLIPVPVAVPLATLLSITLAGLILAQDWRHVHARSAWWLVLPTLLGIPIGLLVLTEVYPPVVKATMAVVIVAFSGYCLVGRRKPQFPDDRFAWAFGLGAVVIGRAANRRMRPEAFVRYVHLGLIGIGVLLLVQSV